MSSSPFEIFRRNLKPAMVALTLLALISFVVLPAVQTYMQQRSAAGGRDAVVAKFGGIDLTESRVGYFTQHHYRTVQFLSELAMETIKRGGTPRTAGFAYDRQNNVVQQLGINATPNSNVSIRSIALANQAERAGFELDDTSLSSWLDAFTDGKFSDREIDARLMKSSEGTMARQHLYVQLRTHLLADLFDRRGVASLASVGQGELRSPLQQWEAFLKMRRSGTFNAYGVLVNDFVEKTNPTPSEAEIKKVYDEAKHRDSDEQSPDPGFHKRYSASFETLVGDFRAFVNEEKGKISEEQLRAEYERRLKGGDFQIPAEDEMDLDAKATKTTEAESTKTEAAKTEAAKTESDATKAGDPKGEEMKPEAAEAKPPTTEEPKAETSKTEEPKKDASKAEAPKTEEAKTEEAKTEEAKADESNADESKAEEAKTEEAKTESPKTEDQSNSISKSKSVRLVALQEEGDEEPKKEEPKTEEPKTEEPKKEEPKKEEPKTEEPKTEEPKKEEPKKEEPKKEEPKKEEPKKEEPKKEEPKKEEPKKEEPKKEEPKKEEPKKEEPKVQGFEAVKDEIAEDLAMPKASARMDAAVTEIANTMKKYFTQNSIYAGSKKEGEESTTQAAPERPDLKALAKRLGFEFKVLGPLDFASVQKEDIARSNEMGTQTNEQGLVRGIAFPYYMFGIPGRESNLHPLLLPLRTIDDQAEKVYITWKVSENEAYTPKLEEVRDDVIKAIRFAEARKLAMAEAQKLAQQVQQENKALADLVPADRKSNYFEDLGPVSAVNPFGRGGVVAGNIPELDSVGDAFMDAAFGTEIGGVGVAFNAPQRVVYLISPTNFEPSMDSLKEQFRQPFNRQIASMIPSGAAKIQQGFVKSVEEKMSLQEIEE